MNRSFFTAHTCQNLVMNIKAIDFARRHHKMTTKEVRHNIEQIINLSRRLSFANEKKDNGLFQLLT